MFPINLARFAEQREPILLKEIILAAKNSNGFKCEKYEYVKWMENKDDHSFVVRVIQNNGAQRIFRSDSEWIFGCLILIPVRFKLASFACK